MTTWSQHIAAQNSAKIYTAELTLAQLDGTVQTKTLHLATTPLNPGLADNYHEPRLKGIPYLRQAIQESFTGVSQITFGRMDINNRDGGLDADLANWMWRGQPITLKLGFEGMDEADFEPVFTGRMGEPKADDGVIQVAVQDYQVDLLNSRLTAGAYSGTVATVASTCLAAAGITDIDATAWATWAGENNFSCYLESNGESVQTLLDRLIAPLACWYSFDRNGTLQIGTFKAPDASTPALTLADDIEIIDFERRLWSEHYWKMTVEYISATSPTTYSSTSRQDSSILSLNPTAEAGSRQTCLTTLADAQTVRDRWWDLCSVRRWKDSVQLKAQAAAVALHDQVYLDRPRYSIDQQYRVVGLHSEYERNRLSLELFA